MRQQSSFHPLTLLKPLLKRQAWIIVVCVVFALVYACSLTFVYIEGDDAKSVAYHALGRDAQLQPPYSSYHAGMDLLLYVIPAQEPLLRVTAMAVSASAAALMVLLLLKLVFDWLQVTSSGQKWRCALVLTLVCPEFFYLGLVYTPTVVAMCLVLASHLLLRHQWRVAWETGDRGRGAASGWRILASALLFGFGGACRWDVLLYGAIIVSDWLSQNGFESPQRAPAPCWQLSAAGVWAAIALGCWSVVAVASGYSLTTVLEISQFTVQQTAEKQMSLTACVQAATAYLSLFTPAYVLFAAVGWFRLGGRARTMTAVGAILLGVAVFGMKWVVPKMVIALLPPLTLAAIAGFWFLWTSEGLPGQLVLWRMATLSLILAPWVFGIRATYADAAWGPDFEISADSRTEARPTRVIPVVGAGTAVPTPEGPRPLFGHTEVLIGGTWRALALGMEEERQHALCVAIREKTPFLILEGSDGYAVAELSGMGLSTRDGSETPSETLDAARQFSSQDGRCVLLLKLAVALPEFLSDAAHLQEIRQVAGDRVVVHGYPATLRAVQRAAPEALEKLGPTTGVLQLKSLDGASSSRLAAKRSGTAIE